MSDRATSFHSLVKDRRSIRRFKSAPVAESVLKRILAAGIYAPSAHNRQPWRFVVLPALEARKRLARRMGERLREDLERDGLEPAEIERDVERSFARIRGAPVAVVVCMDQETMDEYPDPARRHAEFLMGVQGVAMAGQNILLAAHAEGLGGCWICAPLFVPDLVRDELGLPQSWSPQGLILLGYPADPGKARGRKQLEEVALWR